MESKETLYKAAQLKLQIEQLQADYEMMKPQVEQAILELTKEAEKPKVKVGDLGTFCRVRGKTIWEYSSPTKEMEAQLDKVKKEEQQTGIARGTETFIIKFVTGKEE